MGSEILDKCYIALTQQKKIIFLKKFSQVSVFFVFSSQTHRKQSSSHTTMKIVVRSTYYER